MSPDAVAPTMELIDPPTEPIRSILVPTDGSEAARAALEQAIAIATATDATVHLLAVVPVENPMRFDTSDLEELEEAKERLVDELVEACADGEVHVSGAVRRGRPARAILAFAEETDVDLIVLGRTGRDGIAAPLLGSTTDRVLRATTIPVMVLPQVVGEGPDAPGRA